MQYKELHTDTSDFLKLVFNHQITQSTSDILKKTNMHLFKSAWTSTCEPPLARIMCVAHTD